MSGVDMDELRELRLRVQGAEDDKRVLRIQLAAEVEKARGLEESLKEVTYHRNRLLDEKRLILEANYEPAPAVAVVAADPAQQALPLADDDEQC